MTPLPRHTKATSLGWPDWFSDVGRILTLCLEEVSTIRPDDPFEYMAQWLYRYADSEQYRLEKMEYLKNLKESYNELRHEQMERNRRIEDYKAKIDSFKRTLSKYQVPLTILDFLKKRDQEMKEAIRSQKAVYELPDQTDVDIRPGAKTRLYSMDGQPTVDELVDKTLEFDPDLMVRKVDVPQLPADEMVRASHFGPHAGMLDPQATVGAPAGTAEQHGMIGFPGTSGPSRTSGHLGVSDEYDPTLRGLPKFDEKGNVIDPTHGYYPTGPTEDHLAAMRRRTEPEYDPAREITQKKVIDDYYKMRTQGSFDPRHTRKSVPIPDMRTGAPWEKFVHGSIGKPFKRGHSMDLADKVYVDDHGHMRRALDDRKVSVDSQASVPDGFVALSDGTVIPVNNIKASKPEDDPDFPDIIPQLFPGMGAGGMYPGSVPYGAGGVYPGSMPYGAGGAYPGSLPYGAGGMYPGGKQYGADGLAGLARDSKSRLRDGRRVSSSRGSHPSSRASKRGPDGQLGGRRRTSSGGFLGPDGKPMERGKYRTADGTYVDAAIAQWFLDDEGKHLKCDHPILGVLGIPPIVELPPVWFDRKFTCRTFYQPEIYTRCAKDGDLLLDLGGQ